MHPLTSLVARRLLAVFGGALAAVVVGEKVMHRVWQVDRRELDGEDGGTDDHRGGDHHRDDHPGRDLHRDGHRGDART